MKKYKLITYLCIAITGLISGINAWGAEPSMATYTCYPIFQVNAVEPNILIMLDNSGSMNFNAYGTWPGQEGIVRDKPYAGAPYNGRIGVLVNKSSDDAEEWTGAVGVLYSDAYIGVSGTTSIIDGFRFQKINIPRGATITSAYIQFKAYGDWSGAASFTIAGEASDNAATYTTTTNNISSRSYTAATAAWSPTAWTNGTTYNSADLTSVVQEIVSRGGWNPGNAMAFKITGTGFRRAYAQDYASNESYAPMLYIKYAGAEEVQYYGYFNPEFLNRIDEVIIFNSLSKDDIRQIIKNPLKQLEDRIKELGFCMEVSAEAKEYLVDKGYDPKFGARPLNRAIQKYLEDKIAEELLKSDLKTNDKFTVDVDKEKDELIIHIVPSEEPKISKKTKEPEK